MPNIDASTIDDVFTYHSPTGDQAERYTKIRQAGKQLAATILESCPGSPETTLAIRDVQRATMMANAAIACNE